VKVTLNGRGGKVGRVLAPALETAGHELVDLDAAEAMIDFTTPDAVEANVAAALERGVPCVIGTTSFDESKIDALARERELACFHASSLLTPITPDRPSPPQHRWGRPDAAPHKSAVKAPRA